MPKKHSHSFAREKPTNSYVHPSLTRSPPAAHQSAPGSAPPGAAKSVSDRLDQLRREDARRTTTPQQRAALLADTLVTQHATLPPHLRRLLNVPEGAAPAPRMAADTRPTATTTAYNRATASTRGRTAAGGRAGVRIWDRRDDLVDVGRPAGPAAPRSWLSQSKWAPKRGGSRAGSRVKGVGWERRRFRRLEELREGMMVSCFLDTHDQEARRTDQVASKRTGAPLPA